ncbi:carboxylesterase [Holotrichia oblita]|uniref:Carboxylesterase n=1 Tax=Holotrichia oblita TaxID=644536 RepID=A0ACB9TQ73_HOLOL|nr:carboxylesterase [Holotrichia oblita]
MKILPFLQKASVEDIMKVQENTTIIISIHELALVGPIVENIEYDLAFLPKTAEELIASKEYKEVPFMLGLTNEEGIVADVVFLISTGKQIEFPKESDRPSQLWIAGDAWLTYGVYKSIVAHSKRDHKDLYFYVLSADTELNYFKRLHPVTAKYKGASHIDDLGYIFKTKFTPDFKPDSIEAKSMEKVVKLWTNFAKYGNPTPKSDEVGVMWKPVEDGALNFMNIGTGSLKLDRNPFAERIHFWDKLHEKYAGCEKPTHAEL